MGQSIAADDLATAFPMVIAMVWAVATLVWGFAGKRPRNHRIRLRQKARRLQTHP